jgi:hypothetical protein
MLVFIDQLTLVLGEMGGLRMLVRTGTFAASLLLLFLLPRHGVSHPATKPAVAVLCIVAVALFHPTTNTLLSGTAQAILYLAILAPLFWVPRLNIDVALFRRVVLILWGFHTLSAILGVLQVYIPGFFQPSLSSVISGFGEDFVASLRITTASGVSVFRPMGLTDVPGGAAISGFYTALFGVGFLVTTRNRFFQIALAVSMAAGMMVIYLSQVRSVLLLAILSILVFAGVLASRGQIRKLTVLATVISVVFVASFVAAVAIGGESVTSRLSTLIEEPATEVYQWNRGRFLEHTVDELLPQYPLGAGLGRWGMMNVYFGDNSNPDRTSIWAEIMWTGWLLDGGVPLVVAYFFALLLACWAAWKIARYPMGRGGDLPIWGALLLAYNIGVLAITFNTPFFIGQSGMEFWLLNGALFAAAGHTMRPRSMQHAPHR